MPEKDDVAADRFYAEVPAAHQTFGLKGSGAYDWGMANRLARIFQPADGRTVMLAIDHGYFQGPVRGLERVDLNIVPLLAQVDALMLTRGMLRTSIPQAMSNPVVLRVSAGSSILKELSQEAIAVSIEDAIRLNAAAMAVQVYVGGEFEHQSIQNLTKLVDAGLQYGIPVLAVTAVGREMVRDARYFRLACRICAELGAQFVKTYFVDQGFSTVAASCPVPLIVAGGKKVEERDALIMVERALQEGAAGVDMGRNVFQSAKPVAMLDALNNIVHHGWSAERAWEWLTSRPEEQPAVPSA
ncbi:MAG: 3-hydroxy-5-phosphonooxypentane-2,4-dione thiolase [Thermaerobacter sp.]|nr:3-hydroxy-5-phosphonooxypentane-2,4-dione thiolase [Thermaerobacter sp.]